MKTTVVCGVLGAGKTTFLKNILKHGYRNTVVLVNDFGSAGIDGDILSADGIDTIELPSGCICCTLRFDLASKQVRAESFPKEVKYSRLVVIGTDLEEEKIREIMM